MSLGGPEQSGPERNYLNSLASKGILLVAAAGNSGNFDNPVEYPAAYDAVMGVAALDSQERIADFSTHSMHVDISGPGVGVLSLTSDSRSSYSEFSGK
jgi:subtilisin family serine protease